ncbi:hypothetical protein CP99DC5_1155A, partial [Chlamydia psittaci 99DC5]
MLRNL